MDIEKLCNESPETDDAIVDDEGGVVKFNNRFSCLGSAINFVLDDTIDAWSRVTNASKAIGALCFVWEDVNMPLTIKVKSHNAIPVKLLLWGGENWSGNVADIRKYETFHHTMMRIMLKMPMSRVKEETIKSKIIRKYVLNQLSIED